MGYQITQLYNPINVNWEVKFFLNNYEEEKKKAEAEAKAKKEAEAKAKKEAEEKAKAEAEADLKKKKRRKQLLFFLLIGGTGLLCLVLIGTVTRVSQKKEAKRLAIEESSFPIVALRESIEEVFLLESAWNESIIIKGCNVQRMFPKPV